MASDLARDVHLGVILAHLFAIAAHAVLAVWTLHRERPSEARIFAAANGLLAISLGIQLFEFLVQIGRVVVEPMTYRAFVGSQLLANLLVLAIFFQLLATFASAQGRPRGGVRAWMTGMLFRYQRLLVPTVYGVGVVGGLVYLSGAGALEPAFATLRGEIGPTSAYLFGAALWVLCFVMFPARPGQEHLAVPVAGRALLLTSLGVALGLVALYHDSRPRLVRELLLPILHLHSIPVVIFLALVRYEFAFMDRFVLGILRTAGGSVVVVLAYWTWNRVPDVLPDFGALGMSTSRILVLLAAVAGAPWVGRVMSRLGARYLFARHCTVDDLHDSFAARLAEGKGLAALIESTCADISSALRARGVRVLVGGATNNGHEPVRLECPLRVADETVGTLLLGDRRDLLPYFDGERRMLDGIAPALAGAIQAFRQRRPQPMGEAGVDRALATETPPHGAEDRPGRPATAADTPSPRRASWPEPTVTLASAWQSEVLSAAAAVGRNDADAGARILSILDRAAAHLKADGQRTVTLHREFEFARDLVALETLRRENRLTAGLHYPHELADQAVPRGVVLRLMAKLMGAPRPEGGWPALALELSAHQGENRVDVVVQGQGMGALRAQFPRRDLRQGETSR